MVSSTSQAAAHTGFDSSEPVDGDVVDGPVDEIAIYFSGESEQAGEGFSVLDASGVVRAPDSVTAVDDFSWVLGFDEPLGEGAVGVRWSVQAPDAHPIDGSFSFTVSADSAQTTTPTAPIDESPDGEMADDSTAATTSEVVDLETFLDMGDNGAPYASEVGAIGRSVGLIGTMLAIGGLIFATVALRGSKSDIRSVLKWVRRSGILILIGAIVELGAQVGLGADDWSALQNRVAYEPILRTDFGLAVMLRGFGGVILGFGALPNLTRAAVNTDPVMAIKKRIHIGAGPHPTSPESKSVVGFKGEPYLYSNDHAWKRTFLGTTYTLVNTSPLLASYIFDGHTATEGTRWLTATVDIVHVVTAATWAGGLFMMALVLRRRHRRGEDLRALQLAVRFSVIAAIALVLAGAAGIGLTVTILDTPSELWSTPWGRVLIAKTLVVAVGAAIGGYNHKVLIPKMLEPKLDGKLDRKFKRSVTIEAVIMAVVIVITAFLIGASSV